MHPRDRLWRCRKKINSKELDDDVKFVKTRPLHLTSRLARNMKKVVEWDSAFLINNFESDLSDYLQKPLVFNLKKPNAFFFTLFFNLFNRKFI